MRRKKRKMWPFEPFNEPVAGRQYRVRIISADCRGTQAWVRWKHLDGDQAGRTREEYLPLPIRPEGLTADFCRACGLAIDPQFGVEAEQAVGQEIQVAFETSPSGTMQAVTFTSLTEEKPHESDA